MNDTPDSRPTDPRRRVVEALMRLAAIRPFEDIRIADIATEAGVSLADFRDLYPSKGAVLGGFSRMIDREVLEGQTDDMAGEPGKERLFDVLMRRLDAMSPYREGLKGVSEWLRRDVAAALAMNKVAVNAMRFMMEAAQLDTEGLHGAMKLQGLVIGWSRVLDVWFEDHDPGLDRTMAELDRMLSRGGKVAARLDDLHRLTSPFRTFGRALCESRRRTRRDQRRDDERRMRGGWPDDPEPVQTA